MPPRYDISSKSGNCNKAKYNLMYVNIYKLSLLLLFVFTKPHSYSYILLTFICEFATRKVWRYQRGNHNPYIEEEQTTQWPKEKAQKDKQRSTKHTYKHRVTRTPLKTGDELRCSGRVSSSCSGVYAMKWERETLHFPAPQSQKLRKRPSQNR
jgi:hypothetical protein